MELNPQVLDISKNTPGPELFLGLVGPVGVNLQAVKSYLEASLARLDYSCLEVKLSDWISDNFPTIDRSNDHLKLKSLMKAGTLSRRNSKRGDFLALAGLQQIWSSRFNANADQSNTAMPTAKPFTCYVINQIKHQDEVNILRWIYGSSFYLIGIYSPLAERVKHLAGRIEATSDYDVVKSQQSAHELIELDYAENHQDDLGQNIQKAFPQADVFLNTKENLLEQIDRFVELVFRNSFHTPTKDEQSMCLARTASLRSADLARQIGAAITTQEGEVISIGCNEAARPGGGQYWVDEIGTDDQRDFQKGFDSNDKAKTEILTDLLIKMKAEGALKDGTNIEDLVDQAVANTNTIGSARLFDVIEYFRSVHAEMAALIDAARRGISVNGATMYATTFPCHECAKHIVAAGIKRLVYIEPYPKSRALELFDDAIVIDEADTKKTTFEAFKGVAPRRYQELFELGTIKRKNKKGIKSNWLFTKPRLRKAEIEFAYIPKEAYYAKLFEEISKDLDKTTNDGSLTNANN